MTIYEQNLISYLKKNPLLVAPMAGVTDSPFRSFIREMGGGLLTTELVSAIALVQNSNVQTKKLASFSIDQQPVGVQIFGEDPEILSQAALKVEEMGASFVDLNLGCPVNKIVKKGAGSAILKDLNLLSKILNKIKSRIQIPLTIKVRTGWSEQTRNSIQAAQVAFDEGCLWMTIHGRTRSQGYCGAADWNYIAEVKEKAPLPIIGNGDLIHADQIKNIYLQSRCDGLMVGRGCLKNPWIFQEAHRLLNKTSSSPLLDSENVLKRLFYFLNSFYDQRRSLIQFKKFSVWFSSGFPQSSLFRKNIFGLKEEAEVLKYSLDYFKKYQHLKNKEFHYEPFLLQGHG